MKIDQIFSFVGVAIVAFALGYFFSPKKKGEEVVRMEEKVVIVKEYVDTCFAVSIDSMEIYRTVRKGLKRTVKSDVVVSDVISSGSVDTFLTTISHQDELLTMDMRVRSSGPVLDYEYDMTLDTFEIVRLFRIVDSFPVFTPPIMIDQKVFVDKEYIPAAIGISIEAGSAFDTFAPRTAGGVFFQDRKLRRYELTYATDKVVAARFSVPVLKFKK
jgi:hypothetical protein